MKQPKYTGGGWWKLPDGRKFRGNRKAAFNEVRKVAETEPEETEPSPQAAESPVPEPDETPVVGPKEKWRVPTICPIKGCGTAYDEQIPMKNHLEREHGLDPDRPDIWPQTFVRYLIQTVRPRSGEGKPV